MKKTVVLIAAIPYLEVQRCKKDKDYTLLKAHDCYVLKSKLKDVKGMLDGGKTIAEINLIYLK